MRIQPHMRVFEWGSGNSTRWWHSRVREVHAVEHDLNWFREMRKRLPPSVNLVAQTEAQNYVNAVQTTSESLWDVVVIDGEERNKCAALASKYTDPSGVIIFDNTDNEAHEHGVRSLMLAGWKRLDFFGLVPSYCYKSCTSLFYRDDKWVTCSMLPSESRTNI